jgi:hypothetical protein
MKIAACRYYFVIALFLMLGALGSFGGSSFAQAPDPNFFIFLGIGQSNMQGKGNIETSDYQSAKFSDADWARYKKLIIVDSDPAKIGTWQTAKPPIVRPDTKLGVTDYFGRTLVTGLDERYKIGVAVVAVDGGSVISFNKDKTVCGDYFNDSGTGSWVKEAAAQYGNYPYGKLVEMAKIAQKSGVIKGIIYHQGETDLTECTEEQGNKWLERVYELYTNLLEDLNLSIDSVPFIAGEPVQKDKGGACYTAIPWVDKIPEYFKAQSGKDIAYVASSKDCAKSSDDDYHFSSGGYRKLGKRYGEIMLPLLISQGAVPSTVISVAQDKEDVIYDLLGRRLSAPQKGINIINGKKVIIR